MIKPDKVILNQVKRRGDIIYGAQAMNKQMPPMLRRQSVDYDIFSRGNPKPAAVKMERRLDKSYGGDLFYVKPAQHPGTWKVMDKGQDGRMGTKDDFGIVDYSKKPRGIKTKKIGGINYVQLQEIRKDKKKSLKDKESKFRHEKDRGDLEIMKNQRRLKRMRII